MNKITKVTLCCAFFSSLVWQSCLGLVCYSCTTFIDNGVVKPGNQSCQLFNSVGEHERRTKFIEICAPDVKVCSQTEKTFVGRASGSSYEIIQKGCFALSFVNRARFNQCEYVGGDDGSGGKREKVCLCDRDYCLQETEIGEEKVERKLEEELHKAGDSSMSKAAIPFAGMVFIEIMLFMGF